MQRVQQIAREIADIDAALRDYEQRAQEARTEIAKRQRERDDKAAQAEAQACVMHRFVQFIVVAD